MDRMTKKVRWGVLSTAAIGVKKVIPAMQLGQYSVVTAIASRNLDRAKSAAQQLGIEKAYGSYEELLADPGNRRDLQSAAQPAARSMDRKSGRGRQARPLRKAAQPHRSRGRNPASDAARTGVKIGEAFMIRSLYPMAAAARTAPPAAASASCASVMALFSYFNNDPTNIRNQVECGGGALYDIGCYCIQASRYAFAAGAHARRGLIERDPRSALDRLTSAILDFPARPRPSSPCSMQLVPYQRVQFVGHQRPHRDRDPFQRAERPAHAPVHRLDRRSHRKRNHAWKPFPLPTNTRMQGDAFSKAVLEGTEVPVPLEDAIKNMAVIEAIFRSGETGQWESPQT